jgi:translation initiation factor 3 subunit C
MASRFWAAGSESDSDDGSVDSDDHSKAEKEKAKVSRWATVSDSDDSSDEGERVVRSARDRAWDGMKTEVTKMRNYMKINDWNGIQTVRRQQEHSRKSF